MDTYITMFILYALRVIFQSVSREAREDIVNKYYEAQKRRIKKNKTRQTRSGRQVRKQAMTELDGAINVIREAVLSE